MHSTPVRTVNRTMPQHPCEAIDDQHGGVDGKDLGTDRTKSGGPAVHGGRSGDCGDARPARREGWSVRRGLRQQVRELVGGVG